MWIYCQRTGQLLHDGAVCGNGYSGARECKNDPASESKHNKGPIPRGFYRIEKPRDTVEHGPFVLPLTANGENHMYGRGGFLIHGDSLHHQGTASEGCIILDHATRRTVWSSDDHDLQVVEA